MEQNMLNRWLRLRAGGGRFRRPVSFALVMASMLTLVLVTACADRDGPAVPGDGQQVVLITGSTSGLGREVAYRMADAGAHVIVHGRDAERGEAVVRKINEDSPGSARFYRADFAGLDAVEALATAILRDYERLDVLVNNAGIGGPEERTESDDGYELTFQVNYLSHFLLTHRLLGLLEHSAPARIVNVASAAQTPIDFDDPGIEQDYDSWRAYGQSKLAQITFSKTLAGHLADSGVTTYSLHPATFMDTRMVRQAGIDPRATVDEGAEAVMRLMTGDDVEHGGYYDGLERDQAHAQAYDEQAREKLWQLSREYVGLED